MFGISTKYKGTEFRSRAEARWAAFFDLMGWCWRYEPQDLPGWIPDFVMLTDEEKAYVYVEVKPRKQFRDAISKARKSGVEEPVLIVSADGPDGFDAREGKYFLGFVLFKGRDTRVTVTMCEKGSFHFCNPANLKKHHLCNRFNQYTVISEGYREIEKRWAEAHNRTKFPFFMAVFTPMPTFNHCWTIYLSETIPENRMSLSSRSKLDPERNCRRRSRWIWIAGLAGILLVAVIITTLTWDRGADTCQVVADSTTRGGATFSDSDGIGLLVQRIVDGDDLVLWSGERVRYIGVDTPEQGNRYFDEATEYNRRLVEGKQVRLEKDISETDRYGRLLRYVYVGEVMLNAELVREGWAEAFGYQPDIKYADCFHELQREASAARRGIWAN